MLLQNAKTKMLLLHQKLTKDIRTYGAAGHGATGHGKGAINGDTVLIIIFYEKISWHVVSFSTKAKKL